MEWGFFPSLGLLLAERGFAAVRFNFSGAGMAPGDDKVTDLAAFEDNTFSREAEELRELLSRLAEIGGDTFDLDRLGLFGHSRAGAATLLAAADETSGVRALVTWAAIATVDRWTEEQKEQWRREGVFGILNGRTGQRLALGRGLLEDLQNSTTSLDLEAAAKRLKIPWLIVHGVEDETVAIAEGRALAQAAKGHAEMVEIADGNHTLGARHPFIGPTPALIQALNATQALYRRILR